MTLGHQFGPYLLDAEVGRGGMGVVYRATHAVTGRAVALKVMLDASEDLIFRERFVRESRIASSLDHPHVIPVFDTGEHEGRLFIAMSFVEGMDLGRILADNPAGLTVERAVRFVTQAAAALDVAHARGLVHRDVKPANILVSVHGEHVYLSDFGLTRLIDGATHLTSTGQFVGTVAYCAPEQIMGERIGPATDVYALGCVLFHSLTGRLPFQRDSEMAVMYAHIHEPVPDLLKFTPGAPPLLAPVVARALAKSPGDRYPSAGDLARAATDAVAAASASPPAIGWYNRLGRSASGVWGAANGALSDLVASVRAAPVALSSPMDAGAPPKNSPADAASSQPGRLDSTDGDDTPQRGWAAAGVLGRVMTVTAIVLALIVAAGFLLFALGERDRTATSRHLASHERVTPTPRGEARRERRAGALRERVDDANDILLAPFARLVTSGDRWTQRAVPTGLGLLLYGVLLASLARKVGSLA